jgi:glycosyltransferase involved in cell wall biosynthesis
MPKVSVIIPTHNRASLLARAVASVLEQTYGDFEIIVTDDASSDETPDAVRRMGDPRIRYFRHAASRGEAATTNNGIRNATGEYVAFLHDDDVWLPAKLERQLAVFHGGSPRVGAVYSGFISVEAATAKALGAVLPAKRGDLLAELCTENWIGVPSTVMVRRDCFAESGMFDESMVAGADYDMWIRLARHYHFDYVAEPLVLYWVHDNRLSANYAVILRGKEAQLRKHGEFFAAHKKSYSRRLLSLGVLHCYNRNLGEGRMAFLRAIKNDPLGAQPYYNLLLSLCGAQAFMVMKACRDRLAWRRLRRVAIEDFGIDVPSGVSLSIEPDRRPRRAEETGVA